LQLAEPATWEKFARQVGHIQTRLPELIRDLRARGKRVIGYGASAKGSTLLNTCGLTAKDLDYVIDNTPFKQNKVTPGSWIPIRPPENAAAGPARLCLAAGLEFCDGNCRT
jgi:novobiocin biosynthesis protein NovU/D-mycarose 3-C-methyltransferase